MRSQRLPALPTVTPAVRGPAWEWTLPISIMMDGWACSWQTSTAKCTPYIKNNHDETFDNLALSTGIGKATKFMSGWGLKFFDYDNDGNLDLLLCQRESG